MPISINTNASSLNAQRNLSRNQSGLENSLARLSSGFRINKAGDDAAGLAISERFGAQVKGLNQAVRNAQDGVSMIQTAEGAMQENQAMLQRMRELAVQGSNDTLSQSDRDAINSEMQQLRGEVNAIGDRTKFNGRSLLNGSLSTQVDTAASAVQNGFVVAAGTNTAVSKVDVSGAKAGTTYTFTDDGAGGLDLSDGTNTQKVSLAAIAAGGASTLNFDKLGVKITINSVAGESAANIAAGLDTQTIDTDAASGSAILQVGADSTAENQLTVSFNNMKIDTAANGASAEMDALNTALDNFNGAASQANAQALISAVDDAINFVSEERGTLGAAQNRLDHTVANLQTTSENMSAAQSRIRDVDIASESANMSRQQVLMQAGVSVLSQANQAPQMALRLLG